ncbi:hypothetical protein ACHAXR_008412 [Thalassiosira sp. AJA248-18]
MPTVIGENDTGEDANDSVPTASAGDEEAPKIKDEQQAAATAGTTTTTKDRKRGRYYAVRAGYAVGSSLTVKIRSAIFLHWDDARGFVDGLLSSDHRAEYAAFDSVEEAESYLVKGERAEAEEAIGVASAATSSIEKKISLPIKQSTAKKKIRKTGKSIGTGENNAASSKPKKMKDPNAEEKRWEIMYNKLIEYKKNNSGSIDIPKIPPGERDSTMKGLETLRRWRNVQQNESVNMTSEKRQKLKELGFQLSKPWDHMYEMLANHKAETGTLDVVVDNEELYTWTKTQKTMLAKHFQGKSTALSNEQVKNLTNLGFGQSRPGTVRVVDTVSIEAKWNSMLAELKAYKERNDGSMVFSSSTSDLPKSERAIKYWVIEQRREFKKMQNGEESTTLTAMRMQRLTELGFDFKPRPEKVPWEQRIESLRRFVEENGHCRPPIGHPELGAFARNTRQRYRQWCQGKSNGLTDERVNELRELGFVFQAGKTPQLRVEKKLSWDQRFQELLEFKEIHGHCVVPQLSGPLGGWVRMQRVAYKRFKAGDEKSSMTAEKALKLSEAGFCFDASARFKGFQKVG